MTTYCLLTFSSVEEHLQRCGSDRNISRSEKPKRDKTIQNSPDMEDQEMEAETETSADYMDDLSDVSSEESVELSNPFDALKEVDSEVSLEDDLGSNSVSMVMGNSVKNPKLKFYQQDSVTEDGGDGDDVKTDKNVNNNDQIPSQGTVAKDEGIAIDTVKKFSGLDKAAVIGINPYVNEEHADFKKFILNLATRAKDNLIIITTSDNIKQQLDTLMQ